MKVLITGATGFVGSHLADLLTKEGHKVFSLVRNGNKAKEFLVPGKYVLGNLSQFEWIKDLPDDLEAVIHTAGIVHSMNTNDFYEVNTHATEKLINELKLRYNQLKFVFISSLAAAGPSDGKTSHSENDALMPVSEYGRSKKEAELLVKKITPSSWTVSIVRPPMVIGPRDPAILDIYKMVNSGIITKIGGKSEKKYYSFVCVFDLIDVIYKCLSLETTQKEVFYGTFPEPVSFDEIVTTVSNSLNKKIIFQMTIPLPILKAAVNTLGFIHKIKPINVRLTPDKYYELAPDNWQCSSEKSQNILSKDYEWNLLRTIEVTTKDYRQRGWI
jgi:nucleoside-diphosphate-sugar epimerase